MTTPTLSTSFILITLNLIIIFLTLICAYTDLRDGKIRNKFVYPAAALGLLINLFTTQPGFIQGAGGLFAGLLVYGFLWKQGGIGAGDVKILVTLGILRGFTFLVFASIYVFIFACLTGIVVLAINGRLFPALKYVGQSIGAAFIPWIPRPDRENQTTTMPLGPAIFLGSAVAIYLETVHGSFTLIP